MGGWIDGKRYNLKFNGEAGYVNGETIDSWKERSPEVLQGYSRCDVWNLDVTACLWKALPDHDIDKKICNARRELPLHFCLM